MSIWKEVRKTPVNAEANFVKEGNMYIYKYLEKIFRNFYSEQIKKLKLES